MTRFRPRVDNAMSWASLPALLLLGGEATAAPRRTEFRFGSAVGGAVETAVAPSVATGIALGADVLADTGDIWSPSFRLSGIYVQSTAEAMPAVSVSFQLLTARFALCPLRLSLPSLTLRPCGELDYGRLRTRAGSDPDDAWVERDTAIVWLGAGIAQHAEVALGRYVALDAGVGLRWMATNARFVILGDHTVHDVPQWSFGATLGILVRAP